MKRKFEHSHLQEREVDTSKPSAVYEPLGGRSYTLSIALPGSVIANALTPELKTLLASQIARAAAVFCVDEVVVFDDGQAEQQENHRRQYSSKNQQNQQNRHDAFTGFSDPNFFLMHILSYLETPPFLRKHLFPMHPDLKYAGILPSLDMPHHFRPHEWCPFREGVTVKSENEQGKNDKKRKSRTVDPKTHTLVDVGLPQKVSIPVKIPPDTRVTIKLPEEVDLTTKHEDPVMVTAIAPSAPREEAGYYWGYSVRSASSLSTTFTECEYDGGYDVTFGTSERGAPIFSLDEGGSAKPRIPEFSHMLIVFGGIGGLELAVKADSELSQMGVEEPSKLFDYWVNICPGQGSRTIRTEEAVWLGLMGLREAAIKRGKR
ncbi:MAG: hypothetical protein LQ342_003617 [Letrouitia transgressa]|nr:MAG: hypothetical protein LQ342_003617 [Letrouitia transgressa]